MPMPRMPRKTTSESKSGARQQATVPMTTMTPATMMLRRRPIRLLSRAARPAPIMAPTERLAVTTPFSNPVRAQTLLMITSTPAMTPRS